MNNELKNHCEFFQSLSEHYTSRRLIPRLNIRVQWSDRWDEMEQSTIICETGRLFEKVPLYVNDFESLSLYLINELIPRFEEWIKEGKPVITIRGEHHEEVPSYVTEDTWEEWLENSLYWVRQKYK